MRWPWRKPLETARFLHRRAHLAAGPDRRGRHAAEVIGAHTTAAVEAAAGLWSRAFAGAVVTPDTPARWIR